MSASADELTREEAARLLQWWLDAGVDTAVAEEPRRWLKAAASRASVAGLTVAEKIAPPSPAELPADYDAFRSWLEQATGLPLDRAGARRVLPHGLPGAKIMLMSSPPERDDATDGKPLGGDAWLLAAQMLAAIKLSPDEAYSASLACFHSPGARMGHPELERCGEIARRHIALVRPERLLLFGEAPTRALLGETLQQARGRVHRIEGVRAVATYHPRWLLQRPGDKALAWRDLLLLMDEL
jgi:uracil-DNA glycosylase family 4